MRLTLVMTFLLTTNWCFATTMDDIANCTVCHGTNLQGNQATDAPAIAGMESWYLEAQLNSFRARTRGTHHQDFSGMEMMPQAVAIEDGLVKPIALFIATLPAHNPAPTTSGDEVKGRDLYQPCAVCHGTAGEGNEALGAPGLTNHNDWYLKAQLEKYQNGVRGETLGDQQMRAAVGQLQSAEAVRDIISYINLLENNTP